MGGFKDLNHDLSPGWLQQPYGEARSRAHGDTEDWIVARAKAAVKARFPGIGPADALAYAGAERGIERGPGESNSSYATRLVQAWDIWPLAGTAWGMLKAFAAASYTDVVIEQINRRQFSLDGSGNLVVTALPAGSWHIDVNDATLWARFEVLFVAPLPASWGGGPPASNSDEANRIRRIIQRWKPGHATCNAIRIITAGGYWGDGTNWGDGSNWGGDTQTVWTP